MKVIQLLIPAGLALSTAFAQSAPSHLEFEVASVKPADPIVAGAASVKLGLHIDGAQVHINSFSLADYVRMAYRVKNYQVIAPDWMGSQRFDIDAKLPAGGSKDQVPEMLQSLLAERFQVKFHNESREFPVYALQVAPGGTKLKDVTDPAAAVDDKAPTEVAASGGPGGVSVNLPGGGSYEFGDNKFIGKKLTMQYFVDTLTRFMDRPVVDRTGLPGKYDISLALTEDDYRAMLIRSAIAAGVELPAEVMRLLASASDASLHSALRAAGLKLESTKAPIAVIVVDSASRTPTAN